VGVIVPDEGHWSTRRPVARRIREGIETVRGWIITLS
jgi:hypothetical protein